MLSLLIPVLLAATLILGKNNVIASLIVVMSYDTDLKSTVILNMSYADIVKNRLLPVTAKRLESTGMSKYTCWYLSDSVTSYVLNRDIFEPKLLDLSKLGKKFIALTDSP
jgi:hypothetical protein